MSSAAVSINTSIVERTLQTIYGGNARFTDDVSGANHRFFAIPGNDDFRWIIPQDPAYGLPVLSAWQPYSVKSQLKWKSLLIAYRCGVLHQVPGVQAIGITDGTLASLGAEFCSNHAAVIYLGTPGMSRKAVVSLVDGDHRISGVAKVPLAEGAAAGILREANALRTLANRPGLAPVLISCDTSRSITVQEYCQGRSAGVEFSRAYLDWLASLASSNSTVSLAEHSAADLERLSAFELGQFADVVHRASQVLNDITPLTSFWVHGDFAPWNLKIERGGNIIRAVDWEDFRSSGLPLFDYFHFHYMQEFLFERRNDLEKLTKACSPYASLFGISRIHVRKLALAYVLSSFTSRMCSNEQRHAQWYGNKLAELLREYEGTTDRL